MKKAVKYLSLFLALLMTVSAVSASVSVFAYSFLGAGPDGALYTGYTKNGNAYITRVNNFDMTELTVPSELVGCKVVSIEGSFIQNNTVVTKVNLPDTLKIIDFFAFSGCENLETLVLPSGLEYIGEEAFIYCRKLKSINIPASVKTIGSNIFSECESLTEVNLDKNNPYYTLQDGVLYNKDKTEVVSAFICPTDVILPDTVKTVADKAFYKCKELKSIVLPEGVTYIGERAFEGCEVLESIDLPQTVETIGDYAFYECRALEKVVLPKSLKSVGRSMFEYCNNLTEVSMDEGNTHYYMENNVLYTKDKTVLIKDLLGNYRAVVIPEGVVKIEKNAFENSDVSGISVPSTVKDMDVFAFVGCRSLKEITVDQNNAYFAAENNYLYNKDKTKLILAPSRSGSHWLYEAVVPAFVTEIGEYAFFNASINSIKFEENSKLKSIGEYAFSCFELKEITLPDSVEYIGENAFTNCQSLKTLNLSASLKVIDDYAFQYCPIEELVIPNGVIEIGYGAFSSCANLKKVTIPPSVTFMDYWAFNWCNALEEVHISDMAAWCGIEFAIDASNPLTYAKKLYLNGVLVTDLVIPEGVKELKNYAFHNCESLTSVKLPESFESLGKYVFYGCNNIEGTEYDGCVYLGNTKNPYIVLLKAKDSAKQKITVHSNTEIICEYAFFSFPVNEIVIPEGVTHIGEMAFYNCSGLETVTLPESLVYVGDQAFYYSGLKYITIPDCMTSIPNGFFQNCRNLEEVKLHDNVKHIGDYAFDTCKRLESITLPDSLESVGFAAFSSCSELKFAVYGNCKYLGTAKNPYFAMVGFTDNEVTSCTVNPSTKIIADRGLAGGINLKTITLPKGVVTVGDVAMGACESLETVYIPDSVVNMGYRVFEGVSGVKVYCESKTQPEGWDPEWYLDDAEVVWGSEMPEEPATKLGDIDGDGEIKAKDYMMVKRAFLGSYILDEAQSKAADIDGDGVIKAKDYMMVKRHFLGTYTISRWEK